MRNSLLARFWRDLRGAASIEMALALPLLTGLLLGGFEYTRFLILNQKMERTAATMADLVSQSSKVTIGQLDVLFDTADQMLAPFEIGSDGSIIITSVIGDENGNQIIAWQEKYGHGTDGSEIGSKGSAASMPSGLSVGEGENVILCEMFMTYEPIFLHSAFEDSSLYRVSAYRPRFGSLDTDPRDL